MLSFKCLYTTHNIIETRFVAEISPPCDLID